MIIDKVELPDDPTPGDAPPSYDDLLPGPSSTNPQRWANDTKNEATTRHFSAYLNAPLPPLPQKPVPSPPESPERISPLYPPLSPYLSPSESSSSAKKKGKAPSWFPFGQAARAAKEVKLTVTNVVRDLANLQEGGAWVSVLQSCIEVCRTHNLSISNILQEKSVEGHTPIYWAIVKRPPPSKRDATNTAELVTTLLAMAEPLTDASVSDIQLACLDASDAELFQRLRRSPTFARLSGADQVLLDTSVPPDEVHVRDVAGDEGGFVVWMRIKTFQKRMRVLKQVHVEFLARGRIWQLRFLSLERKESHGGKSFEKGRWVVTLALLEHSPPTWIDSHLVINDSTVIPNAPVVPYFPSAYQGKPTKRVPTVQLRLKTGSDQLFAPSSNHSSDICVPLDETPLGNSLQFDGSSFIWSDGSLRARLEAKLTKSQSDCIIC